MVALFRVILHFAIEHEEAKNSQIEAGVIGFPPSRAVAAGLDGASY
jgi:hypothetical protein